MCLGQKIKIKVIPLDFVIASKWLRSSVKLESHSTPLSVLIEEYVIRSFVMI